MESVDGESATAGQIESFDENRLQGYISSNQPAFVYFTADWCITCKVNERVALSSDDVKTYFADQNIKLIEADWTTEDPTITKWLEMYGRVGVPMYLYFPVGSEESSASVLPQILSPSIVIDEIEAANAHAPILSVRVRNPIPASTPNWSIVQDYLDKDTQWHELDDEIRGSDLSSEEKEKRLANERGPHPEILNAQAAAMAILDSGPAHSKHEEAIHFLLDHAMGTASARAVIEAGIGALNQHYPEYPNWISLVKELSLMFPFQSSETIDKVFTDLTTSTEPIVAAHARYYNAMRVAEAASRIGVSESERTRWLESAVSSVRGLSVDVEDIVLQKPRRRYDKDGNPIPFPTMSVAQQEILHYLENLTVGSRVPDLPGVDLAGESDSLGNHRGKVLLLDFWATWCGPCIKSMPELRALAADLPDAFFEIVSISIDADVQSVHDFLADPERMPWTHWYTGPDGELYRNFQVQAIPTYIVIDHAGTIQARSLYLDDQFKSLIRETVEQRPSRVSSS